MPRAVTDRDQGLVGDKSANNVHHHSHKFVDSLSKIFCTNSSSIHFYKSGSQTRSPVNLTITSVDLTSAIILQLEPTSIRDSTDSFNKYDIF